MLVIGLTGSIGMGKSTVAKRFRENGIAVFDADAAVHKLYEGEAVHLVEEAFPGTTENGKVDRTKLAAVLAGDKPAIKRLEAIVHPLVRDARELFLEEQEIFGANLAVLEIPLLFETDSQGDVDVTLVVSAPAEIQRERVLARPGMTEERFATILNNQMPDAQKRKLADYVVDTGREIAETHAEIDKFIEMITRQQETLAPDA